MRFPFAPVDERLARFDAHTDREKAVVLGVSADVVTSWRRRGVSWITADKVAVTLGLLPECLFEGWNAYVDEYCDVPTEHRIGVGVES